MTVYYRGLSAETQLLAATLVESRSFKSVQSSFLLCRAGGKLKDRAQG